MTQQEYLRLAERVDAYTSLYEAHRKNEYILSVLDDPKVQKGFVVMGDHENLMGLWGDTPISEKYQNQIMELIKKFLKEQQAEVEKQIEEL